MVADSHSRFTFLAADLLSAAQPSPTLLPKTRVWGFCRHAAGQTSRQGRCRPIITPGSRACGYKTVSGRHEWLNRDPLGEPGFELLQRVAPFRTHPLNLTPAELLEGQNLYDYVDNNPINKIDPNGLLWGWVQSIVNWFKETGQVVAPSIPPPGGIPVSCNEIAGPLVGGLNAAAEAGRLIPNMNNRNAGIYNTPASGSDGDYNPPMQMGGGNGNFTP